MYAVPLATHNGHLGGKTKVAVVERFKQESMYRLSAKKVAVVEVVVVVEVRLYFKFPIEIMFSYFVSSGVRTAFRLNNIPVLRGPARGVPCRPSEF